VEDSIKRTLLGYCEASISFSEAGIDSTVIAWNRMILAHGPPGTGKTTLLRALAQKVYIRNSGQGQGRYSSGFLLEINSHSLFSKWFSESGKLVMKLFDHISEIADDEECLVMVLIDEVESITAARTSSMNGSEPGDAVRVVNAVLTSLDALRRRSNVMILATSNMLDGIDPVRFVSCLLFVICTDMH
jgi:pachytene checkpoint protein 2